VGHVRDAKHAEHQAQAGGHDKKDRGSAKTDQDLLQERRKGDSSGKVHTGLYLVIFCSRTRKCVRELD
jgi:hypothetical protein